jgi:hypothetical protein
MRRVIAVVALLATFVVWEVRSVSRSVRSDETVVTAKAQRKEETVAFNTKSSKYHCLTCSAAKRCTRNCIDVPLSDAKRRGGVACKICGGTCA